MVDGAIIAKWHKVPGQFVNYGDDLLDVRIEEGLVTRAVIAGWSENQVRMLIRAQMAKGDLEDRDLMLESSDPMELARVPANAVMRVTSSDAGTMRQICAQVGEHHASGSCLALLTTEECEPLEEAPQALSQASAFRVLIDPLPALEDEV
jgi:hypothetical protein